MPRASRRDDLLAAALELFVERGYEGTSVADLTAATELSKAAFVYHFGSKEELLFVLAEPLLDDLDAALNQHEQVPAAERDLEAALCDYLVALQRHQVVVRWIDGDKSILNHDELGARLDANNRRAHRLLTGDGRPSRTARALASAVLGMLWRPIRNGYLPDDPRSRQAVIDLATQAARAL
jgi:AcrR family transcriptional regulator